MWILERAHPAREEQAADDQADAEAHAALQAAGEARPVDALGGAQQVAAVHPGRGHGERRQPQRHRPAGDHEVVGAAAGGLRRDASQPMPMNDAYIRPMVSSAMRPVLSEATAVAGCRVEGYYAVLRNHYV